MSVGFWRQKEKYMVFLLGMLGLLWNSTAIAWASTAQAEAKIAFQQLEHMNRARIGVYAWNTENGKLVQYRADERFAHCSTFKVFLVGEILRQHTLQDLNKNLIYTDKDILPYAPVTAKHVTTGMTVAELCSAALRVSDNTAANLLLREIGGISALQQSFLDLGDKVTKPMRNEPMVNESLPGDWRDTSTPHQLALDLKAYLMGDILSIEKRNQLISWMSQNPMTDTLIRAGVPADWQVVDKSGSSGKYGTCNDIALVTPPGHKPIILIIMTTHNKPDEKSNHALVAAAAKIAVTEMEK